MEGILRRGTVMDIPALVNAHREMFNEIVEIQNQGAFHQNQAMIDEQYEIKLRKHLPKEECIAFVIEEKDQIIASGVVTFIEIVPVPNDPQCLQGYIHSIYTEKSARGKGYGRNIVEALVESCKTRGIKRVQLSASKAGEPLYKSMGFGEKIMMLRTIE